MNKNPKKDNNQLKRINSQNCQKIKLHGTLTTKELKKHSSRLVGRAETSSWADAHRVPKKLDPRRNTATRIIIKLPKIKDKERILKAAREKETVTYKRVPIRLSADFSKETLQARTGWKEVFKVMKGKDLHPRLLYPAKLSFRRGGQ